MARKNDAWGIEVGSNAIKAVRLVRSGSDVELVDFDVLPFKQVLTTPDINAAEMIQVGLDTFLSKHEDVSKSQVVVSVPGHMAFARFAKLPPVEPKKIPDIVRFEAVQQIPFPIDQVEWDYQVFQQADSPDVEVGIFAITKERVLNYLSNFRQVRLQVDELTLSPLAVYNAFAHEAAESGGGSGEGTIYMDIGTQSTDVIIVEQGGIWLRTLPIGGNNFTEALVRAFKLSFPKAEKLKREAGTSKYARQIFQAMRPVFADLVQELQRSIGYYQSLNRDSNLTRLVGMGSTFRLPGLQKFLKQQLQMEVVRPEGFKAVQIDGKREGEFAEYAINMGTAYGLALQGLGMDKVSANLLPAHILQQRMWRAKQPWIGAAAACVAVAAGLFATRYVMESQTHAGELEQTERAVSPIVNRANEYIREWNELERTADPRPLIENLRRLLDYRDLWPKLMEDIGQAVASANPQEALRSGDYSRIQDIPRQERREIRLTSLDAEYIPVEEQRARDQGFGGVRRGGGGAALSTADMIGQEHSISDFWDEDQAPKFRIRLEGTTPYADGPGFITQNFIQWLQDNAEAADRPYRFDVPSEPIISMGRVGEDDADQARQRRGAQQQRDPRLQRGPMMDEPGPTRRTTRRGSGNLDELLPRHPLIEENLADDWQFRLEWVVKLRPPEETRVQDAPAPEPEPEIEARLSPDAEETDS